MSGPSAGRLPSAGGEYIGPDDSTPTTASGTTDSSGDATVLLTSGQIAGPVTVGASVTAGTATYQATSAVVSIGGGVPSATHFSLGASQMMLPGLNVDGATSTITAYVADRFGNYNVLAGTMVSFYTEAGAIGSSAPLDSNGEATVTFRTQNPMPEDTQVDTTIDPVEAANLAIYYADFLPGGLSAPALDVYGTPNPRDGWVTVLAVVPGEEAFQDNNGNGLYDGATSTDTFTDEGDPYIDANDNGKYDPGEFYIDEYGLGAYSAGNGVWDGPNCPDAGCSTSKLIWTTIRLDFTGNLSCDINLPSGFTIATLGNQSFQFSVHDANYNAPIAGTTISVTATYGKLTLPVFPTFVDGVYDGPYIGTATLADPTSGTGTTTATPSYITITATPPASSGLSGCTTTIEGTIG